MRGHLAVRRWDFSARRFQRDLGWIYGRLRTHGVLPRTGNGVPGAEGEADGEGLFCAFAGAGGAEAAGLVFGPGCVFGGAGGGFAAAAGWLGGSEFGPAA